jgi:hypothetical protein
MVESRSKSPKRGNAEKLESFGKLKKNYGFFYGFFKEYFGLF